jgi:endonuclease YncB( thermonuclease family)
MNPILRAARRSRVIDMALFGLIVLALLVVVAILPKPVATTLEGRARPIDGDSLVLEGSELRLQGIDAPEARQSCTRNGAAWSCGREAARYLARLMRGSSVRCDAYDKDQHSRWLATCWVGDVEINRRLVEQGWAVSFGRYHAAERDAQKARRGLWAGEFDRPSDWRAEHMGN